jgi:hypothetical protein
MIRHGLFSLPLVKNKMNFIKFTEGDQRLKKGSAAFGVVAGAAKQEVSAAQQPAPATAEQEVPMPVPNELKESAGYKRHVPGAKDTINSA